MALAESKTIIMPTGIVATLGRGIFAARWLVAPLYFGLLLTLLVMLVKFAQKMLAIVSSLWSLDSGDAILSVLRMVDLVLVANLVIMVMFAGWENFVAPLFVRGDGRLEWLGTLDFSGLKLKLIASIVAIASIQLLESFMDMASTSKQDILWQLAILLGFAVTGVMLALMDRLSGDRH